MSVDRFELPAEGVPAARLCLAQRVPAGDPVQLRAAAGRSGGIAAELRRTAEVLLSNAESVLWRGSAHRAFTEQLRCHAPALTAIADRYDSCADALVSYAAVLDDTAGPLRATRSQLQQHSDELISRQRPAAPPFDAAVPFAAGAVPGAAGVPDPGAELLPLARAFKAGYDRWADGLDRCLQALRDIDEHPATHHLRAFAHHVGHAAAAAVSPFEQAIRHPTLHTISACLAELNTGLTVLGIGLLLLCPPAAAACLAAATVLALAQLAVDSTRRAHGEPVTTTHLGLELAAAIPLGGNAFRTARAARNATHLVPGGGLLAHEGIDGAYPGQTRRQNRNLPPPPPRHRTPHQSRIHLLRPADGRKRHLRPHPGKTANGRTLAVGKQIRARAQRKAGRRRRHRDTARIVDLHRRSRY